VTCWTQPRFHTSVVSLVWELMPLWHLSVYARVPSLISPGSRAYCYKELAVSSIEKAVTTASTHWAYPRKNGQNKLTGYLPVLNTRPRYIYTGYLQTVTHLSTNPAQHRVTLLICNTIIVKLNCHNWGTTELQIPVV